MRVGSTVSSNAWRCAWLLFAITLAHAAGTHAQTSPETSVSRASPTPQASPQASPTPSLERRFFRNLLEDQRAIWTSPFRVRGEDAKWLMPFGATAAPPEIMGDARLGVLKIVGHRVVRNEPSGGINRKHEVRVEQSVLSRQSQPASITATDIRFR